MHRSQRDCSPVQVDFLDLQSKAYSISDSIKSIKNGVSVWCVMKNEFYLLQISKYAMLDQIQQVSPDLHRPLYFLHNNSNQRM